MVSDKSQKHSACDPGGGVRYQIQKSGCSVKHIVGRLLCRYGIMYSDCQAAAKRNRSVSGRTGAARSAVCGRVSVVVPVYAGISTGPLADTKDCKISIDHECGYADGILCESGYRSHVFKIVIINESSVLMY